MADKFLLSWDDSGKRLFESGNDRGVLYQIDDTGAYSNGEEWNGLTAVSSNAGGAEANELWADNIKYAVLRSAETYGGTIECYTYPDSFKQNNGEADLIEGIPGIVASGQKRKAFGFSFRTAIGNDIDGLDHGYKIHLVYNATVNPTEKGYQTINDSPDAITMSYEFETTPINGNTLDKPTAHIEIDTTKFTDSMGKAFIDKLEKTLYGNPATPDEPAKLPTPDELVDIYNSISPLTKLAVDFNISDSVDLFGKVASELQTGVSVTGNKISGTLHYIDDYSSAYGPGEDSGNYLVSHFAVPGETGVTFVAEVINGTSGPVTLDADGILISRITNKDTQSIKVIASKDSDSFETTYTLTGLKLDSATDGAG